MASDSEPSMQQHDFVRCVAQAAAARTAEEVERLSAEVLRRWAGDPRADDLTLALSTRRELLDARAGALGQLAARAASQRA